jgi:hypothetical protein
VCGQTTWGETECRGCLRAQRDQALRNLEISREARRIVERERDRAVDQVETMKGELAVANAGTDDAQEQANRYFNMLSLPYDDAWKAREVAENPWLKLEER